MGRELQFFLMEKVEILTEIFFELKLQFISNS